MHMKTMRGFTLVELMVTVAVAAILLTLAVPNVRTMVQNNRITAQVNDFATAATLARSEAVRRSRLVTLCISSDQDTCDESGSDWSAGWIVIEGEAGGGGNVLRVWEAPAGDPSMVAADGRNVITFMRNGGVEDDFSMSHTIPDCTGDQARDIEISLTGRIQVQRSNC